MYFFHRVTVLFPNIHPFCSWGSREAGRKVNGSPVWGVAVGMCPLLSHATILEDSKRDAGQLETPPTCCRAVEQSDLCPDLQVILHNIICVHAIYQNDNEMCSFLNVKNFKLLSDFLNLGFYASHMGPPSHHSKFPMMMQTWFPWRWTATVWHRHGTASSICWGTKTLIVSDSWVGFYIFHGLLLLSLVLIFVVLWTVYAVWFWTVPDKRWPPWENSKDVSARGSKMVALHGIVRQVQAHAVVNILQSKITWGKKNSNGVRNFGWASHSVTVATTYSPINRNAAGSSSRIKC